MTAYVEYCIYLICDNYINILTEETTWTFELEQNGNHDP